MDTDITPLLTHPDRQRSRKLLEVCLREINYLMSPSAILVDSTPSQEWQFYAPREQRLPQPSSSANVAVKDSSEEVPYVPVESDLRQAEDDELPRKLPRKVNLTNTPSEPEQLPSLGKSDESTWDFFPRTPDTELKTTVLDRHAPPRHKVKSVFEKKSAGEPRIFQHTHSLRSHLSPVRALIPCNSAPTLSDETCFISAGDDAAVKFWRVSRVPTTTKKKSNFDVLPQITYRGHTGIVTCLAESVGNIWSGGSDGGIRGWKVPSAMRDVYGSSGSVRLTIS